MFTARIHMGCGTRFPGFTQSAGMTSGRALQAGWIPRMAALLGLLALGLPGTSSAQALGTMQVAARVVPASVGWTGLAEASIAARGAAGREPGRALIHRGRLVHATAEIHPSNGLAGGRRLLIVTIQHPHN
jgi:hypothetical protein